MTTEDQSWVMTKVELAQMLGVSTRHISAMNSAGKLPAPVRFGRSVRWLAKEIQEWLAAGAPHRDRWELSQKGGRR